MTIAELPETMRVVDETGAEEICGKRVQPGYVIVSDQWEVMRHVSKDALAGMTIPMLEGVMAGGKNVDHITRVTGYFSRVAGWNKGKAQELKDRHRTAV